MQALVLGLCFLFTLQIQASNDRTQTTKKLFQVLGLEQTMQLSLNTSVDLMLAKVENAKIIRSDVIKFMNETIGYKAIEPDLIAIYQKAFTEAEEQELIKFYQTSTGMKLIKTQPQLFSEAAEIGHRKMLAHQEEFQKVLAGPKPAPKKTK